MKQELKKNSGLESEKHDKKRVYTNLNILFK